MPKRRLYSEIPLQSSPTSRRPTTTTCPPANTSSSQRRQNSDFLIQLNNSCVKHNEMHQRLGASELKVCGEDLIALSTILQSVVEDAMKPPVDNNVGSVLPEDMKHLCRFFRAVVEASYCPRAPELFGAGKDPSKGKDLAREMAPSLSLSHFCAAKSFLESSFCTST